MYNPAMMRISDITVLKSVSPISIAKKSSSKTIEFVNNLIKSKDLENFVLETRNKFNISEKGMDITKFIGMDLYALGDVNINAFKLIVDGFVTSTGLPQEYALQIFLLILFNSIIDLKYFKHEPSVPHEFVFGRRNISDKMWEYKHEVGALIVPFDISKTKLKKWIDEQWDSIVDDMDNNFTKNPFVLKVHKNTLLEEEITVLKDIDNNTFKEITNILKQKYPKQKWYESKVKKLYYDLKQRNYLQTLLNQQNPQTP